MISDRPRCRPCWQSPAWASAVVFLLTAALSGCADENRFVEPPPPEVSYAHPVQREAVDYLEATATAESTVINEVRARVRGFLKECLVQEGARVEQGQLLLVIDEEPFRLQLEHAQAKLAEAEAALQKARQSQAREIVRAQLDLDAAQLDVATAEEKRLRTLITTRAVTQEELERAVANRKKAAAQVAATKANLTQADADFEANILAAEANVAMAKSAVRTAEINLGYCRVTAPTSGHIGRVFHDVGNLVGDGEATLLTTVVKYDPIHVYATFSAEDFLKLRESGGTVTQVGDRGVPVELSLADTADYRFAGYLDYHDPVIDKGTGTIELRGLFDNPHGEILPGMFGRIRIPLSRRPDALWVPEQALGIDQAGQYLLVVGNDDKVDYRPVQVGRVERGMRVVQGNIGPQDRVIVEGLLRARPGMKVKPLPFDAPAATNADTAAVSAVSHTRGQHVIQAK